MLNSTKELREHVRQMYQKQPQKAQFFMNDSRQRNCLVGPKNTDLLDAGAIRMLMHLLDNPGTLGMILIPTEREIARYARMHLDPIVMPFRAAKKQAPHLGYEFDNASRLFLRTSNRTGMTYIRGIMADFIWLMRSEDATLDTWREALTHLKFTGRSKAWYTGYVYWAMDEMQLF